MKGLRILFSVLFTYALFAINQAAVQASNERLLYPSAETPDAQDTIDKINWQVCTDSELGVRFLCASGWLIQPVNNALLVVMEDEPDVNMIITKIDSRIVFLEQLTPEVLQKIKQYDDGFQIEKVDLADRRAIKVKAFAKGNAQKRIVDYYFLNGSNLYGLLFSVSPGEEMQDYQFVFQKVAKSFQFVQ